METERLEILAVELAQLKQTARGILCGKRVTVGASFGEWGCSLKIPSEVVVRSETINCHLNITIFGGRKREAL